VAIVKFGYGRLLQKDSHPNTGALTDARWMISEQALILPIRSLFAERFASIGAETARAAFSVPPRRST
jgi:hypothetical protein